MEACHRDDVPAVSLPGATRTEQLHAGLDRLDQVLRAPAAPPVGAPATSATVTDVQAVYEALHGVRLDRAMVAHALAGLSAAILPAPLTEADTDPHRLAHARQRQRRHGQGAALIGALAGLYILTTAFHVHTYLNAWGGLGFAIHAGACFTFAILGGKTARAWREAKNTTTTLERDPAHGS